MTEIQELRIPVKTCVMNAVKDVIAEIPELQTVTRFQGLPTDLGTIRHPSAFIYDSVPEQRSSQNRLYQGDMDVQIDVFIELNVRNRAKNFLPFSDLADVIQAKLHEVFFSGSSSTAFRGLVHSVTEVSVEKTIANDIYGVLSYIITITYRHQLGNAFSLERLP